MIPKNITKMKFYKDILSENLYCVRKLIYSQWVIVFEGTEEYCEQYIKKETEEPF